MNHPHINPDENPASALFRLLQLLPAASDHISPEQARLFEAICFQARRTQHAINASLTALQPLLATSAATPTPTDAPPNGNLHNAALLLQYEADLIRAIAEIYQVMLTQFYAAHPDWPQYQPPDLIAQFDRHYYFPLGKLMQQLPGDITNVARLTPEQGQMCRAVAQYAAQAVATLHCGLAAFDKLLTQLGRASELASGFATEFATTLPDLRPLLAWCRAQAEFMQECEQDYRDAADNVLRAV
jgi:hypothetical protein